MKIFISYSHHDTEIAKSFYGYLSSHGFEVSSDADISIGDNWSSKIRNMMIEADVILAIVSDKSSSSATAQTEISMIIGSQNFRDMPRLFPYIVSGTPIPLNLNDYQCFTGTSNIHKDLELIVEKLNQIKGSLIAKEIESMEQIGKIGLNLDSYIKEVFIKLESNEKRNRHLSYCMYIISFMLLAGSLCFLILRAIPQINGTNVETIIGISVANTLILTMIFAMARFSFILGKSFMVESIRNGDRIHAISFGKFFINAYGDKASRQEVREVFNEWNIDKGSVFRLQDVKDIDPNIIGAFEIIKSAIAKR
jgi:hypothetical protein